jgi:hypothetical protein
MKEIYIIWGFVVCFLLISANSQGTYLLSSGGGGGGYYSLGSGRGWGGGGWGGGGYHK